jgi:hypothetical protein
MGSSKKVHGNTGRRYSGRLKKRIRSSALRYHERVRRALALLARIERGEVEIREVLTPAPAPSRVSQHLTFDTPASETATDGRV